MRSVMNRIACSLPRTILATSLAFVGCSATAGGDPASDDGGPASSSSSPGSSSSSASSSDASSSGSSSGGSSSSGSSSNSSGSQSSTCNTIAQQGAPFDILATQVAAPAPQGGVVADGTWIATSGKMWGSSSPEGKKVGTSGSSTYQITGATIQTVSTGATSGNVTQRTLTLSTTGTTYKLTTTCEYPQSDADVDMQSGGYTATPTTLIFYVSGTGTAVLEYTLTKQ